MLWFLCRFLAAVVVDFGRLIFVWWCGLQLVGGLARILFVGMVPI